MKAPLKISFDVACSVQHAFSLWTSEIDMWWPPDHTVSGQTDLKIVLESGVGGRIYERTSDGVEHDWGEVMVWNPPRQLVYLWHLRQDRADATEVEIHFVTQSPTVTRVEIEHRGWERLGSAGEERRAQNHGGWESLLPHFRAAIEKGDRL